MYQTQKPSEGEHVFMETTETAIIMLETERLVKTLTVSAPVELNR